MSKDILQDGPVQRGWIRTAGHFAQARGAHGVRLWPGERPDCELTFHDKRELFEIVEADQPGRRRSSEYRDLIRRSELGERPSAKLDEDWHVRAANAPRMLEHAAASKKAKGYDAGISLLIHLNLMEHGFARQEIEAAMHRRTACAKNAFQEVWVLWQGRAYPIWKGGEVAPPNAWPRHEDDDENDLIADGELWRSVTGEE